MNEYRTHNCGELRIKNIGENVKISGWVQRIRNLGGMKFIDLRESVRSIYIKNAISKMERVEHALERTRKGQYKTKNTAVLHQMM